MFFIQQSILSFEHFAKQETIKLDNYSGSDGFWILISRLG